MSEFWDDFEESIGKQELQNSKKENICKVCNSGIIYENEKNRKCSNYKYDINIKQNVGTCSFIEWKNNQVFVKDEKCPKCNCNLVDKPKALQCEKYKYDMNLKTNVGECAYIKWKNNFSNPVTNGTISEKSCPKCNGKTLDFTKKIQCENYKFDMELKKNVGNCSYIVWKESF